MYLLHSINGPEKNKDKLKLIDSVGNKVKEYEKTNGKSIKDANILRALGNEAYYLGKPEDAFKYFTEALKIDEELKDIRGKATDFNNIAGVYQDWGKPEKALEYYNKSLIIFNDLKN
ncbi:MAG: tetratricopeptide repeat protein [Candidatus Methanoperedens sp.]